MLFSAGIMKSLQKFAFEDESHYFFLKKEGSGLFFKHFIN